MNGWITGADMISPENGRWDGGKFERLWNEAEEARCDQYEREVRDFYLDERERVRAAKEHAQLQKHHGHHLQPGDPTL